MARRWLRAALLASGVTAGAAACSAKPLLDLAKLRALCPDAKNDFCSSKVLHHVCLVQEEFVLWDASAADQHPDGSTGLPTFDVADLKYW